MLLGVDASRGTATGPDGGDLLRSADVAMPAVRADRAGVVVQGPAPDRPDPHRLGVFGDLRRVIGAGELRVDHQPEASSTAGRVRGVEGAGALRAPAARPARATSLHPIAEQTGPSHASTDAVLEQALVDCRACGVRA